MGREQSTNKTSKKKGRARRGVVTLSHSSLHLLQDAESQEWVETAAFKAARPR